MTLFSINNRIYLKEVAVIEKLPESENRTIGVKISGKIDGVEENKWIEIFDKFIEEHEKVNILVVMDGKISYDLDAIYDDLKWTFKNLEHMNRLAIVSDSKILSLLVTADSPFAKLVNISEKHFEKSQLEAAWSWVKG